MGFRIGESDENQEQGNRNFAHEASERSTTASLAREKQPERQPRSTRARPSKSDMVMLDITWRCHPPTNCNHPHSAYCSVGTTRQLSSRGHVSFAYSYSPLLFAVTRPQLIVEGGKKNEWSLIAQICTQLFPFSRRRQTRCFPSLSSYTRPVFPIDRSVYRQPHFSVARHPHGSCTTFRETGS
jgi:hypothetical protein